MTEDQLEQETLAAIEHHQAAVRERAVLAPEHQHDPREAAAHVRLRHVVPALRDALGNAAQAEFRAVEEHQNDGAPRAARGRASVQ